MSVLLIYPVPDEVYVPCSFVVSELRVLASCLGALQRSMKPKCHGIANSTELSLQVGAFSTTLVDEICGRSDPIDFKSHFELVLDFKCVNTQGRCERLA